MEKLSNLINFQDRKKFKKYNKSFVVYKITNTVNGKIYIGITKQIIKRIGNHIYYFKNPNSNNNSYLHKALRKYGLENFTIEILEVCNSLEELNNKEVYWISNFQSTNSILGYNLDSGGNLKEPNEQNTLNRQLNAKVKPVAQYDLNGSLIQTFYSVKEASRQLNISDSDIHRCHKKNWSRNGFMFKKFEIKPLDKIENVYIQFYNNVMLNVQRNNCIRDKDGKCLTFAKGKYKLLIGLVDTKGNYSDLNKFNFEMKQKEKEVLITLDKPILLNDINKNLVMGIRKENEDVIYISEILFNFKGL
jgi:hypothetical protein